MVDLASLLSAGTSCLERGQVKALLLCMLASAGPGVTRESLTTAHSELLFIVSLVFVSRALPVFKNTVLIKIKIHLSIYISGVLVWFGFWPFETVLCSPG